jgi:hypothetical protein
MQGLYNQFTTYLEKRGIDEDFVGFLNGLVADKVRRLLNRACVSSSSQ